MRGISSRILIFMVSFLSFFLLLNCCAYAAVDQECKCSRNNDDGTIFERWLTVTFMTGSELRDVTGNRAYRSDRNYAIIWLEADKHVKVELEGYVATMDNKTFTQMDLDMLRSYKKPLTGYDQERRYWTIWFSSADYPREY